ncbi:MAG: hypothetical protein U1F83_13760 [Verrucomicrobiota bacterium]
MFVTLIFLVFVFAIDWLLLFLTVRPRSLVIGHAVVAALIVGCCALKADFDLGPHIEIPGWIAGLIIAGLSFFAALVSIGAWRLVSGGRK